MDGKERRGSCIGQSEERTDLLRKPQKATQVVRRDKGCSTRPGIRPLSLEIALTVAQRVSKLTAMVVHLKPETESRLQELAATTGRAPDELIEDAMTGYLAELTQLRNTLDSRYDEIKSGRVKPVDGEDAFVQLRQKSQDRRRS